MEILDDGQLTPDYEYAGFGTRLAAYCIDGLILLLVRFVLAVLFGVSVFGNNKGLLLFDSLFNLAYFILLESGARQATIGKSALGLKVVDSQYQRISFGTSVIRNLSKILSAFILCIGFILILFSPRKQGLHDQIAGTYVVR